MQKSLKICSVAMPHFCACFMAPMLALIELHNPLLLGSAVSHHSPFSCLLRVRLNVAVASGRG